jgi:toxoflavin biosynthesis protein ToxD
MFRWFTKRSAYDQVLTGWLSGDESRIAAADQQWSLLSSKDKRLLGRYMQSVFNDHKKPLNMRLAAGNALGLILPPKTQPEKPDLVHIPGGPFIMGSNEEDALAAAAEYGLPKEWFFKEIPKRQITVPKFSIMRYLVTNAEFFLFLPSTGYQPPEQWGSHFTSRHPNHPAWGVTWQSACDYAEWLSHNVRMQFRLPSEAEWEKAARGTDGRQYPWGDAWRDEMCNTREANIGTTSPVGLFWSGRSPYGCLDIAGNVEEWTSDWYRPYPGTHLHIDDAGQAYRVTRGGAWNKRGDTARCARRHGPLFRDVRVGIRLVCDF